jgi:hypothetical protein
MTEEENAALVIKTGVEQLFVPFHELLGKLLGPAATEVGLSLGDSAKAWRFKRRIRVLQEVKRFVEETDKDIKPIATRLFFPAMDAASIEDDDEMQTRWAALLANEATSVGSVHPSFIDILKQLTPADARLLDDLCDWCEQKKTRKLVLGNLFTNPELRKLIDGNGKSLDNLVRLGLIQTDYEMREQPYELGRPTQLESWYELSDFAIRFVLACRAPAPT